MAAIPCYGGPFDGRFYTPEREPSGYHLFKVKKRNMYLWNGIRKEYLDFATLERAATRVPPKDEEPHK